MVISGMQKLTLLDYPEKTACLLFTQGCNFRCPFCHNSELLKNEQPTDIISEEEVFKYLNKRQGILDGVCITGGEPLLQKDIESFIKKVKDLGFLVKLDTNGSCPATLKKLIDNNLLDYIAMDVKDDFINYGKASGIERINIENIKRSIEIVEKSNVEYEFRTTVVKELHDYDHLKHICEYIGPKAKYYIQNYRDCETVLESGLSGFSEGELFDIEKKLKVTYPNVMIRGI